MTQWERMMVFYGSHHRSRANVIAHVIGVPIILTGAMVPLALVEVGLPGLTITLAWIAAIALAETYFRLDRVFAIGSLVMFAGALLAAHTIAGSHPPGTALGWGLGLFLGGYTLQFVAHGVEGKKPALFENLLLAQVTAPLFVVAEVYKMLGFRRELFARVEAEIERLDSAAAGGSPPA